MFRWCCPKREPKEPLQQSLVSHDANATNGESAKSQIKSGQVQKQPIKSPIMQTPKLQKAMSEQTKSDHNINNNKMDIAKQQRLNKTDSKPSQPSAGVMPSFGKAESIRRPLTREFDKNLISHKKSHLWNEQLKSDLIYLNLKNNSYIYMSYRLTKNQQLKGCPNVLDYFLSKQHDKIFVIIGKQAMINAKLSTINKFNQNLIVANYGRCAAIDHNVAGTQIVIMEDLRSMRWAGIDGLIIMTDNLHTYDEVKSYFNALVKDLSWPQLKKAVFFFPVFMTLQNISQLLFACMSQYVMNASLQKASLDLAFDMSLIEGTNLDSYIIIKSRSEENKSINSVYDHLKTSIVLFGKDFCNETQKLYRDFYIRVRQKTLKDYFGMKQLYRRNPQQFRTKVKQFRDIDPLIFTDLDNSNSLKQFLCEDSGFYYVISSKARQEMGRIFNIAELQIKQIDTPVKYEWDDNATADDFKTVTTSKLDCVAKQQLDQIDLDMGLVDDDDDDLGMRPKTNEQSEMQIKVEQTKQQIKKRMQKIDQEEESQTSFIKQSSKVAEQNRCDRNHRYNHFQ